MFNLLLARGMTFARAHWRGLGIVALALVCFAAGRLSGNRKPEVRTVVQTVTVKDTTQKTETVAQAQDHREEQTDTQKDVIKDIDTIKHPDGTVETKEEIQEVSGVDERSLDDSAKQVAQSSVTHTQETQRVTQTTTIAPKASDAPTRESPWELSLGVGVPLRAGMPPVAEPYGVLELSRLVGHVPLLGWPLYLGAWGELDFAGKNPAIGASVAVGLPGLP